VALDAGVGRALAFPKVAVRPPDQSRRLREVLVEPIRRNRIYQSIVDQIEGLLERGELNAGDQLPSERALAEQFQVSRASVREALRTLELLGIIETRAGGGTFVRQASPDDLARPLTSLISRGHTIQDVIEVRGLVEPALAALAAERIGDEQLAELEEILAAQERKVDAGASYAEEDARFHEVIGQAARNELLVTMLAVIWDVLRSSREQWLQTNARAHASIEAHRRIFEALQARDAESARREAAEHIHAVGEGIVKLLAERKIAAPTRLRVKTGRM
jgi:GntR family transcriptional repressor for pyruvate dehydrogenase complex